MSDKPIIINYFSDVLCVWAWISQRRVDELIEHFDNKIDIRYQFIDIFGDTVTRIENQWANKKTYTGFGNHVLQSAAPYQEATINKHVWHSTRPATSANAHLAIKAVEVTYNRILAANFTKALRYAFFANAEDIGQLETIYGVAKENDLDINKVQIAINNGQAMAALMNDYQQAKEYGIKGSPCFVMNEGRQILFGNVGYRVLQTNIDELLNHPTNEASWC